MKKTDVAFSFEGGDVTYQDLFGGDKIVKSQIRKRLVAFFDTDCEKVKKIRKANTDFNKLMLACDELDKRIENEANPYKHPLKLGKSGL